MKVNDLYEAIHGADGLAEIRGPALGRNWEFRRFGTVAEVLGTARDVCDEGDVWISYAPRVREGGWAEDVEVLRSLVLDADTPAAHQKVQEFVAKTRLVPSAKILTGSISEGVSNAQYVWLIDQVERDRGLSMMRRLAHALDGDTKFPKPSGLMRVVGTFNHKRDPRPVELEFCDIDLVHRIEDFDVLPEPPRPVATVLPPVPTDDEASVIERAEAATFAAIASGQEHRNGAVWKIWTAMLWVGGLGDDRALDLMPRLVVEINARFPRDHVYTESECRASIRSRWRNGVRRTPFPELIQIEDAAERVPLGESVQKVRNVLFRLGRRFQRLSFTRSRIQIADEAGTCTRTVEVALDQLKDEGWVKRTRKSKEGRADRYKLCLPASSTGEQERACTTATPHLLTTSTAPSTETNNYVLASYLVSTQEMAFQSQNPAAFAHGALPLRSLSVLAAAARTISADELANLIDRTSRTARLHLGLYERFGLVVKTAPGRWEVDLANVEDKLRQAAEALGTARIWERRKRRHKAESRRFHGRRRELRILSRARTKGRLRRCRGHRPDARTVTSRRGSGRDRQKKKRKRGPAKWSPATPIRSGRTARSEIESPRFGFAKVLPLPRSHVPERLSA